MTLSAAACDHPVLASGHRNMQTLGKPHVAISNKSSQLHVDTGWMAKGAAALSGMLILCQPVQASPVQQLVLLDSGNSAILGDLKRLRKTEQRFGTEDPVSVLSSRFQGAQQQLQRIELLVKIGQYDNARMQLREGSFKTMRMDLAYGQEMYRIVKPEAVRAVIEETEQLDGQLKRKEPVDSIKPTLEQMKVQLADLAGLLSSLGQ